MTEHAADLQPGFAELPADQWANQCWCDMRQRWSRHDFVPVEDYLPAGYPNLIAEEVVVDLIYGEYLLRKEFGFSVDHQSFIERFPQLESALRRQFTIDDALSSDFSHAFASTLTGVADGSLEASPGAPERIGKYVIVSRIGIGGQAEIFRAVHPALGKEVVLKLARAAGDVRGGDRKRLETEARILARVEHPHLARIFDLDFHEGRPYLVMEFIRGRTLEQFAQQQQPSARDAAVLVAKIARGLSLAHRLGIAHLDIKPSNIVIDDAGQPRLIDFGLAHLADAWHEEVLEPNGLRGTLHFMSPEQARGQADQIDARSDIFALGGVLFFLLTNGPPYPYDQDFRELLKRVQGGDWRQDLLYRRRIPPRLRHVCLKAMQEHPERRFDSAEALARELQRCARGGPGRASRRIVLAVLALLVLGAGLLLALLGPWRGGGGGDAHGARAPQAGQDRGIATDELVATHLTVEVWDQDRFLQLPRAAPTRGGDQLRIAAQLPAGTHYSLFCISADGTIDELEHGATGSRPRQLRYPPAAQAAPLTGPAGTEVILICGRAGRPLSVQELQTLCQDSPPLPPLPELCVLRLGPQGVSVDQRGRALGPPVALPDPESRVCEQLELLGAALRQRVDFFEAVAFCHR